MRTKLKNAQNISQEYQAALGRELQKHIPRVLKKRDLQRLLGPARYGYDSHALNRSLSEPIWNLLDRGGKRWRPVLFLLILRAFGKQPKEFLDIATIFELIHNGTLIVDDVEDGSLLRRGGPALHRLFGMDVAINAGNAVYFLPLLCIFERDDLSEWLKLRILEACLRDFVRLHAGQGTDIAWHRGLVPTKRITERQYLQMCAYKTGCLTRMAATVAGLLGGARPRQIAALGTFAETLGIVFQIQDDLLNIRESALSKKKGLGEDITEGKRSLAVLHALHRISPRARKRLLTILEMHTTNQQRRSEAIAIIRSSGALEQTERTMHRLFKHALRELDRAIPHPAARKDLRNLAVFLLERDI